MYLLNILLSSYVFLNCITTSFAAENIVLIIADDLDLVLDGMTPLTNTVKLIGDPGVTFSNCFVATPVCCPNRASILTGRYQHNHFTINNTIAGGCNSLRWQQEKEPHTFASHLKDVGYSTFYAGKYLNQYGNNKVGGVSHIPKGWDWWNGLVGNSKYYNYSLSINGTKKDYGDNEEDYLTDVIGNLALEFLKGKNNEQPFLMVLAPPAPHAPFTPAKRHIDKYKDVKAKHTPNFNVNPEGKHWLVQQEPSPLPDSLLPKLDYVYRRRWESLVAVDELVANIYEALQANNLLNNTYMIFTSDNGYHIGQFSMPVDKRQPYETDIKVPLLINGPGIQPANIAAPVSSVDIFATILAIGGNVKPSDGVSFLKNRISTDRTVLIEYRGERSEDPQTSGCPSDADLNVTLCSKEFACKCQDSVNNTFSCVRRVSKNFNNIFCVFEDDKKYIEAYDLNEDEYQLNNTAYLMTKNLRHRFRNRLKRLVDCENESCVYAGTDEVVDVDIAVIYIESKTDTVKISILTTFLYIFVTVCAMGFF